MGKKEDWKLSRKEFIACKLSSKEKEDFQRELCFLSPFVFVIIFLLLEMNQIERKLVNIPRGSLIASQPDTLMKENSNATDTQLLLNEVLSRGSHL